MGEEWYYKTRDGHPVGPVSGTELRQRAASGQLTPTDLVWRGGMGEWIPASSLKGLFNSNPTPHPVTAPVATGSDVRRDTDERYDNGDDYGRGLRTGAPSRGPGTLAAITANELGLSSTMLGGITLLGQLYSLFGALAAAKGETGGATVMLVLFLLLAVFAAFLGVMGLITAVRKGQAGGTYCIVGICVSLLAFISSIMLLSALSSRKGLF